MGYGFFLSRRWRSVQQKASVNEDLPVSVSLWLSVLAFMFAATISILNEGYVIKEYHKMTGGMYEFLRSWDHYLARASSARIGQRLLSSTIWIARIVMSWISQIASPWHIL